MGRRHKSPYPTSSMSNHMTAKQRKAMNDEINRQIAENDKRYQLHVDAMLLYTLHKSEGYGKTRLRRVWEAVTSEHDKLQQAYENSDISVNDAYVLELEKIGVDIKAWSKELQ